MQIMTHELRKILDGRRLLIVLVLSLLWYFPARSIFLDPLRPVMVDVRHEMLLNYGNTWNENDRGHFRQYFQERVQRFAAELAQIPEAANLNITTFEGFREEVETNQYLFDILIEHPIWPLFVELQERYWLTQDLDIERELEWMVNWRTQQEIDRWLDTVSREEISFFPREVYFAYSGFISSVMPIILINIAILLAPLYLSERKNRMMPLQYSTKEGRNLFKKKIMASTLAILLVTAVHLGFAYGTFLQTSIHLFLGMEVSGFWYDITFGHYLVLTAGAMVLVALIFGLLTLCLSRIVPNHITILGVLVPILLALMANRAFTFIVADIISTRFDESQTFNPPHLMPLSYLGIILLTTLLLTLQWKRECRLDIS